MLQLMNKIFGLAALRPGEFTMPDNTLHPSRTHVDYFDYLRVMATVCVVFMHTAAERLRDGVTFQWELLNICTSFAFTAVPLFLMMSGYLLLSSRKTPDISFLLRKRLPRLLLPLASWTAVAALQLLIARENLHLRSFLSMMVQSFHDPIAVHLWYMYLIIALYVISPILYGGLHSLDRSGKRYLLALIALVTLQTMAAAVLPDPFRKLVNFDLAGKLKIYSGHLCTFFLGWYLGTAEKRIPNRILLPCAAALWAVITAGTRFLTLRNGEYTSTFQSQSAGFEVLFAACLFLLFKQNANKASRFLQAVPIVPLCLPIYLMHNILLTRFHILGRYPTDFKDVAAMTAVNLVICYFTVKTAASIKPLCYLLTGMPYQDACRSCNWVCTCRNVKNFFRRPGKS